MQTSQRVVTALLSWACGAAFCVLCFAFWAPGPALPCEPPAEPYRPNWTSPAPARPGQYPVVDLRPLSRADTGIRGVDAVVVFSQPGEANARRTRMRAVLAAQGIRNAQWRDSFVGVEWLAHWRAGNFTWDAAYSRFDPARQAVNNEKWPYGEPAWRLWRCTSMWQSFVVGWRAFVASGLDVALFFEDDVDLSRTFVRDVERALQRVPRDWAMLRLGNCEPTKGKVLAAAPNIYRSVSMTCLDSYLLNARNMRQLMDCFDLTDDPVGNPDLILDKCWAEKGRHGIRSYTVIPRIAGQMHLVPKSTGNWTHRYLERLFSVIPKEMDKLPNLH
eukprot:m51a1_g6379 hypothetical protein (331) ;mRNA; f:147386-148378